MKFKKRIGLKLNVIIIVGNLIGALLAYMYFSEINPIFHARHETIAFYAPVFFIIGTIFLILSALSVAKLWKSPLMKFLKEEEAIDSLDEEFARKLKERAIQMATFSAILTLLAWLAAGFIFGLLEPVVSQIILGIEPPDLISCIRRFFGITVVGGSVTTLFIYFATESVWRKAIPEFFPEGNLNQVRNVFKLSVRARLLIVFISINIVTLPLLGIAAHSKAQALHSADAISRAQILSSLSLEIVFITAISLITSIILSIFVSKSVSIPLNNIENAMKEVERGNLDVRVKIISNDEIGSVAEGFNLMVNGLKDFEAIKDSFGKYVSLEIRDEILSGRVPLDGEMKRVTLLFSDLRDFTPFVESTHPKQVITLMNQYFTEMTESIKKYRGLVLQYVGDEIEAVFGAPVRFDDHPDMAVEAALEMRKRIILLNKNLEKQGVNAFRHGIGIHTGAVLAGNVGSKDRISYAMVGDTVNLASRIEGLTKQHSCDILLSQTTYSLLTGNFITEQLPAVRVKGKKEDVMIYKLVGKA